MAPNNNFVVRMRRQRQLKTDYRARRRFLMSGQLRLVVRKSLKNITAQIVAFEANGDKVLLSAHSNELKKLGWNAGKKNISASYLLGLLLAKKAKAKKIPGAVADLGLQQSVKGSRLYALILGAVDGGLKVPVSKEIFPDASRVRGEHIASYAKALQSSPELYKKRFSGYLKSGIAPEKLPAHFDEIKKKLVE